MPKNQCAMLVEAGWPEEIAKKYAEKYLQKQPKEENGSKEIISVIGVSKRFGANQVLENINLRVYEGEILGVLGLSGVGKTTLLNLLVGFLDADEGDIIVQHGIKSFSVFKNPEFVKQLFGFATQTPSFYSKLTVKENIDYFATLYGIPQTERIIWRNKLIDFMGLANSKNVLAQNLSGGMQKRLDMACSAVHKPKILILDEPTADLDSLTRKQVWDVIQHLNRQGTTIIIASHFLGEIEEVCDRLAVLRNKTIQEVSSIYDLKRKYTKDYEIQVQMPLQKQHMLISELRNETKKVTRVLQQDNCVIIYTSNPYEILDKLLHLAKRKEIPLGKINVDLPSIKEVFEQLVKQK